MIIELQHKYPLQNLINQTRIKETNPIVLSQIHYEFGRLLGLEILGQQEKISIYQELSQGKKERLEYFDSNNFVLVGILRAGLYIAEGIRSVFPHCEYVLTKDRDTILPCCFKDKKVILADSVINTGKTIRTYLSHITYKKLYIATHVIYKPTALCLANEFRIKIVAIRLSHNSYVGKGSSDTGNRLFNTTIS